MCLNKHRLIISHKIFMKEITKYASEVNNIFIVNASWKIERKCDFISGKQDYPFLRNVFPLS